MCPCENLRIVCRKNVFSLPIVLSSPVLNDLKKSNEIKQLVARGPGLQGPKARSTPNLPRQMYAAISSELSASRTNRLLDPRQGPVDMVLCSDHERVREELAAAGECSRDTVVNKYKSLVRERREVWHFWAR